jgi:hypothetical protein
MQGILRYKWSLASGASTALNFLVVCLGLHYGLPAVVPANTHSTAPVVRDPNLYWIAEVMLGALAIAAAIGGMFRREPPLYTRLVLLIALFACAVPLVRLSG